MSNNLSVSIPHQLTRAEARARVDEAVEHVRRQSAGLLGPVEASWQGDTMAFAVLPMGTRISGDVTVEDRVVRVDVVLPWFLAALTGTVRQAIEAQGRQALEHRRT